MLEMTMDRRTATRAASHAIQRTTLSERADELEERMMHELNGRIATRSVLFGMADGKIEIEDGAALQAGHGGKYFLMGLR
jgi:hypothetical protein